MVGKIGKGMCVPACMCTCVCVCVCVSMCFPGRVIRLYQCFLTLTRHLEIPRELLNDIDAQASFSGTLGCAGPKYQ